MGVALDCNWRRWNGKSSVPGWPQGNAAGDPWAYQRIAAMTPELSAAGFSAIRMPPSCEGAAGVFSAGYDKHDDYSIDGTAFGSGDMLRACVGAIHAQGMQAYGDLVLHQYGGGTADGVYATKRFPKHASCFVGAPPRVAADPVPDQTGNFAFGDMASYYNSTPGGYMYFGAIKAAKWLTKTTGFDGYRFDDVKGTYAPVVKAIIEALGSPYCVGEYFDGQPTMVGRYVNQIMDRSIGVLDFAQKFNVGNICNNAGRVWMGQLSDIGWCTKDAATAMTFIESADTDNSPGEQVVSNKMLGYAIMLTFTGYPCVYYRDWSDDPNCYGLKDRINNLIWIHEHLAQGAFVPRLDNHPQVFAHERLGFGDAPGCVCFFNNDPARDYTVTVATSRGANARLHEFSGNGGYNSDRWTDGNGNLTVTVPRNVNGLSYLIYAPWITPPAFAPKPIQTTQVWEFAADLVNTKPAVNGVQTIGTIAADLGHPFHLDLKYDETTGSNSADLTAALVGNELQLTGTGLPKEGVAGTLTVTYMGA